MQTQFIITRWIFISNQVSLQFSKILYNNLLRSGEIVLIQNLEWASSSFLRKSSWRHLQPWHRKKKREEHNSWNFKARQMIAPRAKKKSPGFIEWAWRRKHIHNKTGNKYPGSRYKRPSPATWLPHYIALDICRSEGRQGNYLVTWQGTLGLFLCISTWHLTFEVPKA